VGLKEHRGHDPLRQPQLGDESRKKTLTKGQLGHRQKKKVKTLVGRGFWMREQRPLGEHRIVARGGSREANPIPGTRGRSQRTRNFITKVRLKRGGGTV